MPSTIWPMVSVRGRAHGVEDAEGARLDHADRPLGEVACVDELHGVAAVARGEHVAAAVEAHRPVGEPVALVARADDEPRPDHGGDPGEPLLGFLLGERLERAVEPLDVGAQGLLRLLHRVVALVGGEWRRLVLPGVLVRGVDGQGRDEDVVLDLALQHLPGVAHPERQRRGVVDADVPLAAGEGLQVAGVAVPHQLLDRRRPLLRAAAAVEERELVARARARSGPGAGR